MYEILSHKLKNKVNFHGIKMYRKALFPLIRSKLELEQDLHVGHLTKRKFSISLFQTSFRLFVVLETSLLARSLVKYLNHQRQRKIQFCCGISSIVLILHGMRILHGETNDEVQNSSRQNDEITNKFFFGSFLCCFGIAISEKETYTLSKIYEFTHSIHVVFIQCQST